MSANNKKSKTKSNNNNGKKEIVIVEKKAPKKRSSGVLSSIGSLAGGAIGGPAGALLGKAAGSLISHITGFGKYKIRSNSLLGYKGGGTPMFERIGVNRFCRREHISDVLSGPSLVANSTLYDWHTYYINPTGALFKWASTVAQSFDEFKLHGMIIEFRSTSGNSVSSTNTALGSVGMATQYDVHEAPFVDMYALDEYESSNNDKPSVTFLHAVECDPKQDVLTTYLVPPNGLIFSGASIGDLALYNYGIFTIATQGMQAAGVSLGQLWVTYDIEFIKPKMPTPGYPTLCAHITESPANSATAAAIIGTAATSVGVPNNRIKFNSFLSNPTSNASGAANNSFNVWVASTSSFGIAQVGTYLISCGWSGATIGATATLNFGSNISGFPSSFVAGGQSVVSAFQAAACTLMQTVTVSAYGIAAANTISITGLTSMAAATCDIVIVQIPYVPITGAVPGSFGVVRDNSANLDLLDRVAAKLRRLEVTEDEMLLLTPASSSSSSSSSNSNANSNVVSAFRRYMS